MTKDSTIQTITRKQYNLLVPGQQTFYNDLIASGRVRIIDEVPVKNDPPPHQQKKPRTPIDPITRLRGQKISVLMSTGQSLEGILQETSQYELIIDNTIILKHAIISINPSLEKD